MKWLIENWYSIVILIGVCIMATIYILNFTKLPVKDKESRIRKFFLGVVIAAEREFGSKTGQLKLADAYGAFVAAYPFIKMLVSFSTVKEWVDIALDDMKEILDTNKAAKEYVEGTQEV